MYQLVHLLSIGSYPINYSIFVKVMLMPESQYLPFLQLAYEGKC